MHEGDWLGWLSSFILLVTIIKQIHTQWKSGTGQGVSPYLFIGQAIATSGFIIYSNMVGSTVFVVTNSVMLLGHVLGMYITWRQKHKKQREQWAR